MLLCSAPNGFQSQVHMDPVAFLALEVASVLPASLC